MKKILRVIFRISIVILMMFFSIMITVKIGENKNLPNIITIIIPIFLMSITIILGITLLSNPTVKLSFKKKTRIKKGKKNKDFVQLCENIKSECESLNIYRKKAIIYLLLITLSCILIFLIPIINKQALSITVFIILALIISVIGFYKKNLDEFKNEFKKAIIKKIVYYICPKLQYQYDGNSNMFETYSSIFPKNDEYNGFETSDYIYGEMNGIHFQICKISLLNFYGEKSDRELHSLDTFLFSQNELNFSSPSIIILKPNNYFYTYNTERIQMDDEEFEKYFDVFSDSDMITMQILTHDVMEELVSFYTQYRCKFEIIIKDNKLFIKFLTGDVFNPKVLKKITDSDLLWTYYTILNFVTRLCIKINNSFEGTEI